MSLATQMLHLINLFLVFFLLATAITHLTPVKALALTQKGCDRLHTHTHTHTHIYIYIYIYICVLIFPWEIKVFKYKVPTLPKLKGADITVLTEEVGKEIKIRTV